MRWCQSESGPYENSFGIPIIYLTYDGILSWHMLRYAPDSELMMHAGWLWLLPQSCMVNGMVGWQLRGKRINQHTGLGHTMYLRWIKQG
ncbi:unnamed protein product [Lasius platythorax]|uniref:Uncharacterized protein n=1 Tax=Lasius platythorax TaxID=488582 RepID=A0AAV2MY58_9HYME